MFYYASYNGLERRVAKFSHSSRGQLSAHVLSDTANRLKLSNTELDELVDCSLDHDQFQKLWSTRG